MNTEARELAKQLYIASVETGAAQMAATLKAADLYETTSPEGVRWAEGYVRSCLVAQRRVAA